MSEVDIYPADADDSEDLLATGRGMGGEQGKRARRIQALERQGRALEMRKAGANYDAIARSLGYASRSGARNAVVKAMARLVQEPAKELRSFQYERLNHMLLVLWPSINTGEYAAIDRGLAIMRQMDALMGTDAPTKHQHTVSGQVGMIVAEVNEQEFIAQMQQVIPPHMLPSGDRMPDQIIDASSYDTVEDYDQVEVAEEETEEVIPPRKLSMEIMADDEDE